MEWDILSHKISTQTEEEEEMGFMKLRRQLLKLYKAEGSQ